jgi:hypothetical protein
MLREWQDTDYVFGLFGNSRSEARKEYESMLKRGLNKAGEVN